MITFPHAKINLGLHVIAKRPDGFHNIESIFYPITLHDAVEFVPGKRSQLKVYGNDPGCRQEDNLVWKAWQLLGGENATGPLDMAIYKNIPFGGGLGGGSADGAFMLEMLNDFFGLGHSQKMLFKLAAQLGSDCPFFLQHAPCLVTSRGDKLQPVKPFLQGYKWVIVVPNIQIFTKEAYANVNPVAERPSISRAVMQTPGKWKSWLVNDFEEYAMQKYPKLSKIKKNLYDAGALYASMTGSGACIFGIFECEFKVHLQRIEGSYVYSGTL